MGNKLCAPLWKKPYRDGESPWYPKKDSHLLRKITEGYKKRLWAEVFQVTMTEGELGWERVSEDVVPVNITCIQDYPETMFQVTAYNRHVMKIFDTRLVQPGTKITQSSDCFVHWKDEEKNCEWGLNFTTPIDARRFIDCCETSAQTHRVARKATSSTSLRLSPPKKLRAKKAISAPNSPAVLPRRTVSSPDDLATTSTFIPIDGSCTTPRQVRKSVGSYGYASASPHPPPPSSGNVVDSIATIPRNRQRQIADAHSGFGDVNKGPSPSGNKPPFENVNSSALPRRSPQDLCTLRSQYGRQNSDPVRMVHSVHNPLIVQNQKVENFLSQ
ncbi:protein still life, isoform SIF type 1-like [Tubulanus polymorphus]|uniref:protein still life, isoform SIF type 1-like n=1 Tax=Tubulanus polymorphus TaxID=672921 RepID=UPI003DA52D94